MKKLSLALTFISALSTSTVFAHATIGVIDIDRAVFETEAWKLEQATLTDELQEDQTAATTLQQELAELQSNLQINAPVLTITELQRIQEEAQFKQLKLQQIGERVQSIVRSSQASFLDRYRQLLGEAVNDVYEAGSYDIILKSDSIVLSGFTFDITSEVTAKLNQLIADLSQ